MTHILTVESSAEAATHPGSVQHHDNETIASKCSYTVAMYFLCLKIVCINLCGLLLYSQNFNRSKSEKLMFAGDVSPTTSFNTTF